MARKVDPEVAALLGDSPESAEEGQTPMSEENVNSEPAGLESVDSEPVETSPTPAPTTASSTAGDFDCGPDRHLWGGKLYGPGRVAVPPEAREDIERSKRLYDEERTATRKLRQTMTTPDVEPEE